MKYKIKKSEKFNQHLEEFIIYYKQRADEKTVNNFLDAVEKAVTNIGYRPKMYTAHQVLLSFKKSHLDYRKAYLIKFPCVIIYSIEDNLVYLEAIYHQSRRFSVNA